MMMLARIAVVAKTLLLVYQANQITAEVTHEECAGQESFEAVNAQGLLQREKSELKEQKWGWLFEGWGKKETPAPRPRKPRRRRRRRTPTKEEQEEEEVDTEEEEEEADEKAAEEEAKGESLYGSLYGTGP
eukprot:TRINITY_DN3029_c0_g1_i2.p1 TRINITY_DN3029_c0_g1~~TRINITY_DN3029_c0_g1_i2.p1  ORF type:complete len:131 (+),score=38.97 TRINITY_DN3029_c0_g1_i2:76-468(+)